MTDSSCEICQSKTKNDLFCNKCTKGIAHNHALMAFGDEPNKGSRELIAVSRRLYDSARFREIIDRV